jgi:hypothetical protein
METKSEKNIPKDEKIGKEELTINLSELYKYDVKDMNVDITVVKYSNLAWVQVTPRDVEIDFLEMPGVKKDGKMMINGTRIYMSHFAAQKLSEVLTEILKQVHNRGDIEQFSIKKK